jgi:hypothetical protein
MVVNRGAIITLAAEFWLIRSCAPSAFNEPPASIPAECAATRGVATAMSTINARGKIGCRARLGDCPPAASCITSILQHYVCPPDTARLPNSSQA